MHCRHPLIHLPPTLTGYTLGSKISSFEIKYTGSRKRARCRILSLKRFGRKADGDKA